MVVGEVRTQTCSATCVFGGTTACMLPVFPSLTISRTLGSAVSADFMLSPLTDQLDSTSGSGPCPATLSGTATSYSWVKLVNTGATPAKVSVWESRATGAATDLDTVAAWYSSAVKPSTAAERVACTGFTSDTCTDLPCVAVGDYAGFVNTGLDDERITVPANSFVFIYTGAYDDLKTGSYKLHARTDTL
jgi:hypothetical protein